MNKLTDKKNLLWIAAFISVIIISAIRFYFKLSIDTFSFLDEYITYDTAAGYYYTGRFYTWDFHHGVLSATEYTRAWPHTVLLALWYHIFGMSVVTAKYLSALFGVLSVASIFYITRRIFEDVAVSFLSCVIFITNMDVAVYFRQIRMYSLWMLVMIWFVYVVFITFTRPSAGTGSMAAGTVSPGVNSRFPHMRRLTDKELPFIQFSAILVIACFLLFVLSYYVHINSVVAGPGMLLFLAYLAVFRRDRRCALLIFIGIILLGLFFLTGFISQNAGLQIPVITNLFGSITGGNIGFREELNTLYYHWVEDFMENKALYSLFMVLLVIFAFRPGSFKPLQWDFMVYCFLICFSSVIIFVCVLTRYYSARYMIYVAPLLSIMAAVLFVKLFCFLSDWLGRLTHRPVMAPAALTVLTFALCLILAREVMRDYFDIYSNSEIPRHTQVYELIRKDAENSGADTIPAIAGYDIRYNYLNPVIPAYNSLDFERDGSDIERLEAFIKDNPTGYVTIETSKLLGMDQGIKDFLDSHTLISGPDTHSYGITVVKW